jgi:hypothetical protein
MRKRARLLISHLFIDCLCLTECDIVREGVSSRVRYPLVAGMEKACRSRRIPTVRYTLCWAKPYRSNKAIPKAISQTDHKI